MGHDQLFKRFFHEFLQDFLELFYPDVAARLNFTTLEFLDTELFTDFPGGSVREADVVARVQTREGVPEAILVHYRDPVQAGAGPRAGKSSIALNKPCG